jgi:hypothetical protein
VDDRPRWSITWLFRLQREGRRPQVDGDTPAPSLLWKALPWLVLLALLVEVAIGVWLGLLPR